MRQWWRVKAKWAIHLHGKAWRRAILHQIRSHYMVLLVSEKPKKCQKYKGRGPICICNAIWSKFYKNLQMDYGFNSRKAHDFALGSIWHHELISPCNVHLVMLVLLNY
jgi:hypothetical protein